MSVTLEATRYLSGVALTISLFDQLLNLSKEIELVWTHPRSWTSVQFIMVIYQYGGGASMLFIAYVLAGYRPLISNLTCHGLVVVALIYGIIGSALSQFMVLLRAVSLWDNRNSIRYALIGGFVVCLGVSFAFTVSSALRSIGAMSYSPEINACVINENAYHGRITGYMVGAWGGMLLYDAYVFVIKIANAMNVPRRRDVDIIMNLRRDGVFTFLAFFSLRLLQLLPSVFNNASYIFLTPMVAWALDNALSFRLFLKMKAIEMRKGSEWGTLGDIPSVHVMQTVELDVE